MDQERQQTLHSPASPTATSKFYRLSRKRDRPIAYRHIRWSSASQASGACKGFLLPLFAIPLAVLSLKIKKTLRCASHLTLSVHCGGFAIKLIAAHQHTTVLGHLNGRLPCWHGNWRLLTRHQWTIVNIGSGRIHTGSGSENESRDKAKKYYTPL